jgi:hypothetical protein
MFLSANISLLDTTVLYSLRSHTTESSRGVKKRRDETTRSLNTAYQTLPLSLLANNKTLQGPLRLSFVCAWRLYVSSCDDVPVTTLAWFVCGARLKPPDIVSDETRPIHSPQVLLYRTHVSRPTMRSIMFLSQLLHMC